MTGTVGKYWHTLRHLRPTQIFGRLWFRLARPRPDLRPAPPRRAQTGAWTAPVPHYPGLTGPDRMRFLGEERALADHGWDDPALGKLWRYNQHYFDDLTAAGAAERHAWNLALLSRWVRDNPPGAGTAWEPYPTSLRIVNWVKWALAGNRLPPECLESLAVQARWLARRLEIHLLGNHLLANAKALVFAGCFFGSTEADEWLELGLGILKREVPEQFLSDGGHFERTPMYHALALEDMLDLCNVSSAFLDAIPPAWRDMPPGWRARIDGMRHWLATMTHPDGEVAFFNDAAIGIAPAPATLQDYAVRLGFISPVAPAFGTTVLQPSGYVRIEHADAVALLDVAPVGPDYLPGHAHADTLSCELSLFGQRVLVNSGTSRYGLGEERARQRGTAAHNTVCVDGADSSEVWGAFRVARRARPLGFEVREGDLVIVECAHDGYRRLPGRVEHRRRWTMAARSLVIEDRLTGTFDRAQARYHLHPGIAVEQKGDAAAAALRLPTGEVVRFTLEHGHLALEETTWHPAFGAAVPNRCLVVTLNAGLARAVVSWERES